MKGFIEQICQAIPPSSLISRKVQLKQRGADEYLGLCPFHNENTPSFSVSDKKGFYHCFGCGAHGDIFGYLMKLEGFTFREALEELARQAGVKLPKYTPKQIEEEQKAGVIYHIFEAATKYYQHKLQSFEGKSAMRYLKNRGLSDEIIQQYRLGFAPTNDELAQFLLKHHNQSDIIASTVLMQGSNSLYNMFRGRIIFPIIDKRGRVIAFGGRILTDGEPKYLNSPDNPIFKKGATLYGMHNGFESAYKLKEAIIVEGYMDVISLANQGITNGFAPLGTALRMEQIALLWAICPEPTICMDSDAAGRKSAEKTAIAALQNILPGKSLKFTMLHEAKDPDEMVTKFGVRAFRTALANAKPLVNMLFDIERLRQPLNTPEQRLDLKQRLQNLCEHIKEEHMKKTYRQFFMGKFFELFSRKIDAPTANDNDLDQGAVVSSVMEREHPFEREILSIIIQFPHLLLEKDISLHLLNMEVSCKKLDIIRNKLLTIIDFGQLEVMSKGQEEKLRQEILTSLAPEIILDEVLGFREFLHLEDPKPHLERLFKLDELRCLQDQVVFVQESFCKQPSTELFEKLKHLKDTEEQLKLQLGIN